MVSIRSDKPIPARRPVPTEDDQRRADQLVLLLMRDLEKMGIKVNYLYTPDYIVQAFTSQRKYLEKHHQSK